MDNKKASSDANFRFKAALWPHTSWLQVQFLTGLFEVLLLRQLGDTNVDTGPEGGTQVGGAEGQVAELRVVSKRQFLLQRRQTL